MKHGSFDVTPSQTGDRGKAFATWRTVSETTPESLRTFENQRDAVGSVIVRAHGLVPGWSGPERSVSMLTDTGGVGSAQLRVIYYEPPHFRVDQSVAGGRAHLTGVICALDKPFSLNIEGRNAGSGPYAGSFKFAPAGTTGGSWTHKATTTCLPELGCGTVTAQGTFQVDSSTRKPVIIMNETTQISSIGGEGGTSIMPGWQFELEPETGVCSPD
jgi:hypothetical protein